MQKALHLTDQGLKVYGVAHGIYSAATGIAAGVRTAYQVAAPLIQAAAPSLAMFA